MENRLCGWFHPSHFEKSASSVQTVGVWAASTHGRGWMGREYSRTGMSREGVLTDWVSMEGVLTDGDE